MKLTLSEIRGAVDDPREDVATEVVLAEPVLARRRSVDLGDVLDVGILEPDVPGEHRRDDQEHEYTAAATATLFRRNRFQKLTWPGMASWWRSGRGPPLRCRVRSRWSRRVDARRGW